MKMLLSLVLGYLLGCIHPAALVGKLHHVNLKEEGTGNLGATNAMMVLGRRAGIFVAAVDILKSYFSARIARVLFPQLVAAGLIASLGSILGHCFPITLHFDGGRGLAAFGGMILAYNFRILLFVFVVGWSLMVICDAGVAATVWGSIAFPILVALRSGFGSEFLVALAASVLLICMHTDKIRQAWEQKGGDHIRENLKQKVFQKKSR